MPGPDILPLVEHFQGLPEFPLLPRRLENADYVLGSLVEGSVAQHQFELAGKSIQCLFDEGREGRARLARGIGKFDQRDPGVIAAENRRVRPYEYRSLFLRHRAELLRPLPLVVPGADKKSRNQDSARCDEQDAIHSVILLLRTIRIDICAVNESNASAGIDSKPNSSIYSSVQETPLAQGCISAGIQPACNKL